MRSKAKEWGLKPDRIGILGFSAGGHLGAWASTNYDKRSYEAIAAIRPALQSDGGDIVFREIDADGVVHVQLVGACGSCPVSTMTLKAGVERIIMDRVPGITEVVADE